MRRLALIALTLVFAGTAHADVYAIVPSAPAPLQFAPELMTPPATPVQLSYPQLLDLWQRAGATYGIPWQVLAAINKVESNFGRNMGPSTAGAIGWMQFMPATWLEWGIDGNGDGIADPWNPYDAVYSAARYLAASGGATDLYHAVFAYNHADWYVQEVLNLANLYGANQTMAYSLDQVQQNVDAARQSVADLGQQLTAARDAASALQARANRAALFSERLALSKQATLAAIRGDTLQAQLTAAQGALDRAQKAADAASFANAASNLLAGPSAATSGYVFPVGGGPGVVFASHTHHDFPAVDIAAPMGSPEYALADSTVLRAWTTPDPRCGIGFTLQAFDGQTWTYCHLAVLDANVVPGAHLTAGQEVGLVGMTGDATGPHLHLQLQPPTSWPQQEPWFQSFAGTAFQWSDGPAQPAYRTPALFQPAPQAVQPASAPVFEVIPQTKVVLFSRH